MPEATANISWLPFDPRDWEQLTPAFGRLRSMVGAHGPKFIVNNRAAAFFDRCVHEGLLDLALLAPGCSTLTEFGKADCERRTIHAAFRPAEAVWVEPREDGQHPVERRSAPGAADPAPGAPL